MVKKICPAVVVTKNYFLTGLILLCLGSSTFAEVKPGFTADKSEGCSPLAVSFTNTSIGATAAATYRWDFGNGNISTMQHAGAIFTAEKSYIVTLTITDEGKTYVQSMDITVHKKPIFDFTASITRGCLPLEVDFSTSMQQGNGSALSYYWDFGDGITSGQPTATVKHTYHTNQSTTVSLTLTNNYGCHSTLVKKNLIDVLPLIKADFEADKKTVCQVNDPIQFTNKSQAPGTLSYLWDFGNGQTSTQKDPSYVFNNKGTYSVKLSLNSSEGCIATATKTDYLNVANFSTAIQLPALICKNATIDIKAICTPLPTKLDWEIDGVLYYNHNPDLQQSFYKVGTHTIKLTASYGSCQQTVTRSFEVKESPSVKNFLTEVNSSACGAPALVNFKDTSADAVKWEWSFNYQYYLPRQINATTKDASYTYPNIQSYNILLRAYNADGCFNDVTKSVYVGAPYVDIERTDVNFPTDFSGCGPLTLTFKAKTQETIVKYNWIFDNYTTSSLAQPTYTFSSEGYHHVRMEYETDKGCKGTAYYDPDIVIRVKPKTSFKSLPGTTICGNSMVTFIGDGGSLYFPNQYWYINGVYVGSSYYNSFKYQFSEKGKYTIRLITDNYGCKDTLTKQDYIEVIPPFVKLSGVKNSCDERDRVVFSQASRYCEKWHWDFGDGQTADLTTDEPTIAHQYAASGKYKVMLTVTNGQCSVKDSTFAYVLLKPSPLLSATTKAVVCANESLDFKISNLPRTPYPGHAVHYYMDKWEYGDGTLFTGQIYRGASILDPLPYSDKLTGFDAAKNQLRVILKHPYFGCFDTSNYIPLVAKGSKADYQLLNNNICYNTALQVKDISSTGSGGVITQLEWDFGDGQKLTAQPGATVTHSYASPGNYPITLKVTDDAGCVSNTSQATQYAKINGPKASFTTSKIVVPLNEFVNFYNSTNDYSNYRATYQWDFGNGNTATSKDAQQAFAKAGKYLVSLTATDPVTGCTSTATQEITIEPAVANFSIKKSFIGQNNCIPLLANFSATSVNADSLSWDFGDGTTAGDINYPTHVYDKPGKYIIILTAYGANGLTLQYKDSIIINEPQVSLSAHAWEACEGQSINWNLAGINTKDYLWDFGDGNTSTAQDGTTAHMYTYHGTFYPTLLLKEANGCMMTAGISDKVIIHANPDIRITSLTASACLGQAVQLNASGANTYVWSPSVGLDDPQSANPFASPAQTTTYKVEGTDVQGCKNIKDFTITVHPPFSLQLTPQATICQGDRIMLNASGAARYNWINTTSGLSSVQSNAPTAMPGTTTKYTVVGYDNYNCFTDTADVTVTVNPLPVVSAGHDVEVEAGERVELTATGDNEIRQWLWSPSTYLSCINCSAPVSIPQSEIKYTITATNQYGCKASDEVIIKLLCDESRIRIPNAFSPDGDGKNDLFVVKGISLIKHLVIFNRYGNKIFERNNFITSDPAACWNGYFNGNLQPAGIYVYFIEMQCPKGEVFVKKGTVILIGR